LKLQVLERVVDELHSLSVPLFVPCSNARSQTGEGRDKVVPKPLPSTTKASERASHLSALEFVGQLIGLALRSGNYLPLNFPALFWKFLVGEPANEHDVRAIDLLSCQIVERMRAMDSGPGAGHASASPELKRTASVAAMLFDSTFADETFTAYDSGQHLRDIVPGGKDIKVNWNNRTQFCEALIKYRQTLCWHFDDLCFNVRVRACVRLCVCVSACV
jgi:hypothetical protein